jgi:hypothetical protein
MSWFNRKQKPSKEERLKVEKVANLEIVAAKEATDQATKQAIDDANQLKDLLERNHFSVTLYIAVGGKKPRIKGKRKHA